MQRPPWFWKFLPLLAILPFLPGCLVYDLFTIHKLRKDRYGDGGPYAQQIHAKLHADNEPGTTVFYTGRLPVSLANLEDRRMRLTASTDHAVELIFEGVEGERMCFRSVYREEVGNPGPSEQKRVDDLFRSFKLAAEFSGPEDSPEVQKRNHVFPRSNFSALDKVELLEQKPIEKRGRKYLINSYRVCGKALPTPSKPPSFLTVAVEPHNTDSDRDPYLLVWQLFTP